MGLFEVLQKRVSNNSGIYYKREGSVKYIDYKSFFSIIKNISNYFLKVGIRKNDRVAIMLNNSPEWLALHLACLKIGAVVVPIHYDLPLSNAREIIEDSNAKFIFSDKEEQFGIKNINVGLCKTLEESFKSFVAKEQVKIRKISDESLATICYTSGSTGKPKGAVITHKNILFVLKNQPFYVEPNDRFLSFLPLSHLFELVCSNYNCIYRNANICFAEGIKQISENAEEYKPTILTTVPLLLEKVHNKVFEKKINKILINIGLSKFVGFQLKKKLGGKLKFIVTGGAPLAENILGFYDKLGVNVFQGYGLTEASPLVATNFLGSNKIGSVGKPIEGVDAKIGENGTLLIKTPGLLREYTKKGEKEKRMINGYFDTGDIAHIDNEGYIFINGRNDELIVMNNGKKVYPQPIEKKIESFGISSSLIYGNGRDYLTAFIYHGEKDFNTISRIIEKVNFDLPNHAKIKKFALIDSEFSLSDGTLTATLKKRRNNIVKKYKGVIDGLYEKKD